jgi:O-antigen/teichoic acid export membrane protein
LFKKILLNKSIVGNLIANYGTTISGSLLSLLFTPIYIYYLNIEAYGIIGFIASLMVFLNFLDLGMGQTINREMAKFHKQTNQVNYVNNLLFSLQTVYIIIGVFCALLIVLAAPVLSHQWFNAERTPVQTVTYAFIILGITIACRWPYAFFASALRGMQYQVLLNSNEIFWNIVKTVGAFVVLKYFSGTLISFLWYQCAVVLLQTLTSIFLCWRLVDKPTQPRRFDFSILKSLSGYIASMGIASILVALIFQVDKIILSKTLQGVQYGYYVLSYNLSAVLFILSTPVAIALFPHFTSFIHKAEVDSLQAEFHKYTKILSVTLLPAFLMLIFFTPELISIWTNNPEIVKNTTLLVRIMSVGVVLDAYMVVPNTLLLAYSKTRFILITHIIALLVMLPATYFLSIYFGAVGGAISVASILGGYFVFSAPFIVKHCLPGHYFKWLWHDILKIALPLIAILVAVKLLMPPRMLHNRLPAFIALTAIGITLVLAAIKISGIHFFNKYLFFLRKTKPMNGVDNNTELNG